MQESRRRCRMELRVLPLRLAPALLGVACAAAPPPEPAPQPANPPAAATPTVSSTPSELAPPQSASANAANEVAPPNPVAAPAAAPVEPPPLPRGTTVLHVGDSFAGALGVDLNRELASAGVRGILRYQTSSYIPTWASTRDLDRYLWDFHPDLVLVTLGANELLIPDPRDRIRTIQHLVKRFGDRPCVWIGPPLWPGARPDLLATIRESCAPCVYLDSTALVPDLERAHDHIHPSGDARKRWAKVVVAWLAEHRDPSGQKPWSLRND